ncbi:selenocysteine lyase [Paraliobacillus quinghaiensis]|uniref:Selenocysteine lyase n=1 Tax=Paraliobacillus quinghaiensis TaxID=470815 RepID=A0A917TLE7_9BACI|nr:aminotransferase class V-fold PLP-dependent enzyme [Paraliobacillus quinghaiensis]GGM27627.1 selenocysteine lyase [Paraliobacillus quinghaiensis]
MFKAKIGNTIHYTTGDLEQHFKPFRENIIGYSHIFKSPYGSKKLIYADWTASGRLYRPIETKLINLFGPYIGNTHTESTVTGTTTTTAYHHAQQIIKKHVNASDDDILISDGTGMTAVVNKLQRLLGLRAPDPIQKKLTLSDKERPIIFVSHMEHHSNYLSWKETIGDVIMLPPDINGCVDTKDLHTQLNNYKDRTVKIGAFTACSNVTGKQTNYHQLAKIMHKHGGICFIDFAASAPYVSIDMHPKDPLEKLDGVLFSPHKFLGGPGTSGILILSKDLLKSSIPDNSGGGTVLWTDMWGGYKYALNPEDREDGGTPGFMQAIKTALCIQLKERMGIEEMLYREKQMLSFLLPQLEKIDGITILEYPSTQPRLGIIAFHASNIHHHLFVKLLNDRFGIQARGGCSCAGPYGHYLYGIDEAYSEKMAKSAEAGDMSLKPGWIRISLHPVMSNKELRIILLAIKSIVKYSDIWEQDYRYNPKKDTFEHINLTEKSALNMKQLFTI